MKLAVSALVALLFVLVGGRALASVADTQVPLIVPNTVTGANPFALSEPAATTETVPQDGLVTPAPVATPGPSPASIGDTGIISTLITKLLQQAWHGIADAANAAQTVGARLYVLIAIISLTLAAIPIMLNGDHHLGVVRLTIERVVETSLWIGVITNTWTGLGWFPALISSGAYLGAYLSGLNTNFNVTSGWDLDVLPGNLLNFGGQLFGAILGATVFTPHGILSFVTGAFNGTFYLQCVVVLMGLATAGWAFLGFAYAALRLTICVLKVYLLAPLSVLQALAASRRMGSYGGSYFAGSLVLGIETMLVLVIVGLFYNSIKGEATFFQALWAATSPEQMCKNIFQNPASILSCVASLSGYTQNPVSIAGLFSIDITTFGFMWALRDVPRLAADAIQGRFTASTQELVQQLKSSPSLAAQVAGYGAGIVQDGASHGVQGAAMTAFRPVQEAIGKAVQLGAMVAVGAATGGVGAGAVATAAGTGAMLGGVEGGIAAGLGKALLGNILSSALSKNDGEENTISSGDEPEDEQPAARQQGATSHTGDTARSETSPGEEELAETSSGMDDDAARTRRATVETMVDEHVTSGSQASADKGAPNETKQRTVVTELTDEIRQLTAAIKSQQSSAQPGQGQSSRAATSDKPQTMLEAVASLGENMSLGRMFAQRAIYMNSRTPKPPQPPPKEDSATMSFGLTR